MQKAFGTCVKSKELLIILIIWQNENHCVV